MKITTFKENKIFKCYKIEQSCFSDDYRILVDIPRYEKKNESIVEIDGKTERLFPTRELAVEYILNQIDKYMNAGIVDNYTMDYKI